MSAFDKKGADRMAREIARLVDLKRIDARSAAADALLDYLQVGSVDGSKSVNEWCEKYDGQLKGGVKQC